MGRKDYKPYMKKTAGLFQEIFILIELETYIFLPSFIINRSLPDTHCLWCEGTLVMAEHSVSSLHLDNLMSSLPPSRPNEIMHAKSL